MYQESSEHITSKLGINFELLSYHTAFIWYRGVLSDNLQTFRFTLDDLDCVSNATAVLETLKGTDSFNRFKKKLFEV